MINRVNPAIAVVLACAALWGFWWYPVALFEGAGLSGPWIGLTMSAAALPAATLWCVAERGGLSARAVIGCGLVGAAISLYAIAASYTDFIRAVLLFYLAPAWSTLIEILFMGRRWANQALAAIIASLAGVLLISRGEISFDGLGAIGDWMALASGLCWSAGTALVFASDRAPASRVLLVTALGGVLTGAAIAWADGSAAAGPPDLVALTAAAPWVFGFAALYMGAIMGGTMWGAFRLPPATMSYLLSVEIVVGVFSSAVILGERFGAYEVGGAICIVGAVLIEVVWTQRREKPAIAEAE